MGEARQLWDTISCVFSGSPAVASLLYYLSHADKHTHIHTPTNLHLRWEMTIGDAPAYMHDFPSFPSFLLITFLLNQLLRSAPPVL